MEMELTSPRSEVSLVACMHIHKPLPLSAANVITERKKKGENVLDVILFFVKVMMIQMKARKLNGFEMLDYPDPSANPIHSPKRGNSGGRGGNSP